MREIFGEGLKKKIKSLNSHWTNRKIDSDLKDMRRRKYFDLFYPLVTAEVNKAVVLMRPRRVGKTVILWQTIQKLIDDNIDPDNILFLTLDTLILVRQSIAQGLTPYRNQIHTITYDNGLEFSEHQNISQTLSANIYFAHPYSS